MYFLKGMRGDPGLMGPPGRPGEQGLAVSSRRNPKNYNDRDQNSYYFAGQFWFTWPSRNTWHSWYKFFRIYSFSQLIKFCRY